jgi:hypothetical protein
MSDPDRRSISDLAGKLGRRLRFPQLFVFVLAVFLIDLAVPDLIPFADEILLGLLTVLLGSLRSPQPPEPPRREKDVTPRR